MNDDTPAKTLNAEDLREAALAAARAYGVNELVIVGRASLAATLPEADASLRATMDVDLFPPFDQSKAAVWAAADTKLGRLSEFRNEHGFYVERVAEWTTDILPSSWRDRATTFDIEGIRVTIIHPLDLVISKLVAGRDKDYWFVRQFVELGASSAQEITDFIQANCELERQQALCASLHTSLNFEQDEDIDF